MRFLGIIFLFCQLVSLECFSQGIYKVTYHAYTNGVKSKQEPVVLYFNSDYAAITKDHILNGNNAAVVESNFIDQHAKLFYKEAAFPNGKRIATIDSTVFSKYQYILVDETKEILKYKAKKATVSINSNSIELWYTTDLPVHAGPNEIGLSLGLVLEYVRNGNSSMVATRIEKLDRMPESIQKPSTNTLRSGLDYRDLLWKSRFVQVPIFQDEKIAFVPGVQSDSILRFAEGTVIVKKVKIPHVEEDSQAFLQVIEKSNGDAYDRTGSVFLIAQDKELSFLDGMKNGLSGIPYYENGDGKKYQGMVATDTYSPAYELMRFFTPFGVNGFNDKVQLKGKTWQDSVIYRQEISEFLHVLAGKEVYIGVYIGNYDKGGHKVSVELTMHPGKSSYAYQKRSLSLFNTTNLLEMGGQEYATLFGQERGLEFEFNLLEDLTNVQLRYITTGHGGWGNGDEFVPKVNSIYLDGNLSYQFTPWRVDCGSYRLYNPVSGNFENGLSSSDLSRSNWCPGTVTSPIFIPLGNLKAGKHTLKVHIPQGISEGTSFSFWNVSGTLVY